MSGVHLTYPLIGIADSQPGREAWEWFWDAEDFSTCESWRLADRRGMLIADGEGRCWRISSVRDLGVTGRFWSRVLRFMVRQSLHRLDQTLDSVPAMTFDDVKARLCAAIDNNPDYWGNDEAIAGEDGPPRDERDLLDERKAEVMRSNSVPELISNLWEEDLGGLLAQVERTRPAKRAD